MTPRYIPPSLSLFSMTTDLYKARASVFELLQPVIIYDEKKNYPIKFIHPPPAAFMTPRRVLGCRVTHPVWMYSISCRNTSGSNSSMIMVWCSSIDVYDNSYKVGAQLPHLTETFRSFLFFLSNFLNYVTVLTSCCWW